MYNFLINFDHIYFFLCFLINQKWQNHFSIIFSPFLSTFRQPNIDKLILYIFCTMKYCHMRMIIIKIIEGWICKSIEILDSNIPFIVIIFFHSISSIYDSKLEFQHLIKKTLAWSYILISRSKVTIVLHFLDMTSFKMKMNIW